MCQPNPSTMIYPVVVVEIEGIKCPNNSYVSSNLMSLTKNTRLRQEIKQFKMSTEVSCVDRPVLLTLPNPHYREVISNNPQLQGVEMNDVNQKPMLWSWVQATIHGWRQLHQLNSEMTENQWQKKQNSGGQSCRWSRSGTESPVFDVDKECTRRLRDTL